MNRQILTASTDQFIGQTAGVQCDARVANFIRDALFAEVNEAIRRTGIKLTGGTRDIPDARCFDVAAALRERATRLSETSPTITPLLTDTLRKGAPILLGLIQDAMVQLADIYEPSGEFPAISVTAN